MNNSDLGLLILRLGGGINMALFHGWGKISAGPEMWAKLGASMPSFGLGFEAALWGFAAAFSEFVCALLVILGVQFRFACAMLVATMAVAVSKHVQMSPLLPNSGWSGASHALVYLTIFAGLFFVGPGKHIFEMKK